MLGIIIAKPYVTFVENTIENVYDSGALTTNAALAGLLRGSMNPDPSAFYPLFGRGAFVDNVLQVENKEDTDARNSTYYGVIPLITPIVDGTD